ncbi:hypothetical protein LDC_1395, partial [sediment metagenome]
EASGDFSVMQLYKLGLSATNSDLIICGSQDNGTNFYDGSKWKYEYGAMGWNAQSTIAIPIKGTFPCITAISKNQAMAVRLITT